MLALREKKVTASQPASQAGRQAGRQPASQPASQGDDAQRDGAQRVAHAARAPARLDPRHEILELRSGWHERNDRVYQVS